MRARKKEKEVAKLELQKKGGASALYDIAYRFQLHGSIINCALSVYCSRAFSALETKEPTAVKSSRKQSSSGARSAEGAEAEASCVVLCPREKDNGAEIVFFVFCGSLLSKIWIPVAQNSRKRREGVGSLRSAGCFGRRNLILRYEGRALRTRCR